MIYRLYAIQLWNQLKLSTEAITKEMVPMREEIKTLSDRLAPWINQSLMSTLVFHKQMEGDKEVVIDKSSNIHVDGEEYKGTPGLWMLVMLSSPKDYTNEDLANYKNLVKQTNIMHHPRGVKQGIIRPTTMYKWRYILQENRDGDTVLTR